MPRFIEIHNPTGLPPRRALWWLLKRGLSRGYAFMPHWSHYAHASATAGGPSEVALYADGSGLEVVWRGRRFVLGVERVEPPEPRGVFAVLRCFAFFIFAAH